MKLNILDDSKNKVGEINLPSHFEEELRPDLIRRAVLSIQSHKRQGYASGTMSGKRSSAKLSRRRRDYRGSYGFGISRVPRKILTRRGSRMNWVGAFAPGTVGGRRAHPPKIEKNWWKKINEKERIKAIRSAIAATISRDIVIKRGHLVPDFYPFILDNKFETINKTKEIISSFKRLNLEYELNRVKEKKVRAGKGKSRGRKYKKKKGPLVIVSQNKNLSRAASSICGVDVIDVKNLNVELLAPGGEAGRLTLWTQAAINILEKEKLYE